MPECAFHRGVETNVRCVECDRYICPKDFVTTPVGYKCKECARPLPSARRVVKPRQLVLAAVASLAAGTAGAFVVSLAGVGWFLVVVLLGMLVGEASRRASGGHRAASVAAVAGVGMAVGALIGGLGLFDGLVASGAAVVYVLSNRW